MRVFFRIFFLLKKGFFIYYLINSKDDHFWLPYTKAWTQNLSNHNPDHFYRSSAQHMIKGYIPLKTTGLGLDLVYGV